MLLATIGNGGGSAMIAATGSLVEITSDLSLLLHEVYGKLNKEDPNAGDLFKMVMQYAVSDKSPVWEKEAK